MEVFTKVGKDLTLSQEIEQSIKSAILNKTFVPGQKLPSENEMCEMFAVSRTALREALQMLSTKGLISIKRGSGIYVKEVDSSFAVKSMGIFLELNLDKEYITHIIEMRKILEPNIAKLAARHRSLNDLENLKKNLVELENCSLSDYEKQGIIDKNFHLTIAKSALNPMIPVIVEPIFNIMPKIRMLVYAKVKHAHNTALKYHRLIVEKIEERNEEGAKEAMEKHLQLAEKHSRIISKTI